MIQEHSSRYIPLCPNGNPTPILYIDANAPLDQLQAFAEQRVRSVAQVLDSLSLVSGEALESRDLAYIAHLAAQALEEGCECGGDAKAPGAARPLTHSLLRQKAKESKCQPARRYIPSQSRKVRIRYAIA